MSDNLRPIGTQFEITYPGFELGQRWLSTDTRDCIITYEVIGYERPARFLGDTVGGDLCEEIRAIAKRFVEEEDVYSVRWDSLRGE